MRLIVKWILFSLAIYATAYLLPGIHVPDFLTALMVALGLGIINAILRPILLILTLPINFMTLGLFTFVINALMVMLAAQVVPGFAVDNFWWAVLFSLVVSVINGLLNAIFHGGK